MELPAPASRGAAVSAPPAPPAAPARHAGHGYCDLEEDTAFGLSAELKVPRGRGV